MLFDTPGIHKPEHEMNRRMVDTAVKSIGQGDVIVWVNEVTEPPGPGDAFIERLIRKSGRPVVLALNKIDRIPKPKILPALGSRKRVGRFDEIIPALGAQGRQRRPARADPDLPASRRERRSTPTTS